MWPLWPGRSTGGEGRQACPHTGLDERAGSTSSPCPQTPCPPAQPCHGLLVWGARGRSVAPPSPRPWPPPPTGLASRWVCRTLAKSQSHLQDGGRARCELGPFQNCGEGGGRCAGPTARYRHGRSSDPSHNSSQDQLFHNRSGFPLGTEMEGWEDRHAPLVGRASEW